MSRIWIYNILVFMVMLVGILDAISLKHIHKKSAPSIQASHSARTRVEDNLSRVKRKIFNFDIHPFRKWELPIKYLFDETYTDEQKGITREILENDFEANTCIDFLQINTSPPNDEQYIYFKLNNYNNGTCTTDVGREHQTDTLHGQPIKMGAQCFNVRNGVLYTVASTLGLLNEMNRPDRNLYVDIESNNIQADEKFNFAIHSEDYFSVYDIPYDYGSLMHAAPDRGVKDDVLMRNKTALSVVPKDRRYIYTPGQTGELSFFDYLALNRVYCNNTCRATIPCKNNGYQDPVSCSRCKCRDGFAGRLCDEIAEGSDLCTPSSGELTANEQPTCVESPNYGNATDKRYKYGDSCAWKIVAPEGRLVDMWFEELDLLSSDMSVYATCLHWVEIRYKGTDQPRGIRYCRNVNRDRLEDDFLKEAMIPLQGEVFTTRTNEPMVTFRAPSVYTMDPPNKVKSGGFKLCFSISNKVLDDLEPEIDPLNPNPVNPDPQTVVDEDSKDSNTILIIGSVVGFLLLILIILVVIGICVCLTRKRKEPPPGSANAGYQASSSTVVINPSNVNNPSSKEEEANLGALANPAMSDTFTPPTYREHDPPPEYEIPEAEARKVQEAFENHLYENEPDGANNE